MTNYVKFMRGTPKAYAAAVKNDDTLYFISEADASNGRLYLGGKEIICDGGSQDTAIQHLRDLLDVSLPEDLGELIDGQVLAYDVATESWVAKTIEAASGDYDVNQFELDADSKLSILDFATAPEGALLSKSADGKVVWIVPDTNTDEGLAATVEALRTDVDALEAKFDDYDTSATIDSKIATALADINHLSYKTVDSIDAIDLSASDADRYIYLVKNGDIYDEYMVVEGKLEKVGDWGVDLSDYATKSEVTAISTQVEDLASQLNSSTTEIEEIKNNIANINTDVGNLSTNYETISSKVDDLESSLNAAKTSIEQNTADITALQSALDNKLDTSVFNEKMEQVDTDLDALKTAMTWTNLPEVEE